MDEADPKLKEFLEIMQPASKSKTWATGSPDDGEPPTKIQAIEVPDAESDDEYETVPKKTKVKSPEPPQQADEILVEPVISSATDQIPINAPDATDDDWMRSRTNRLLDLVDPKDIATISPVERPADTTARETVYEAPTTTQPIAAVESLEGAGDPDVEQSDPTIDAIKSNGRLFVRNLPYTATEEDLRAHFQVYGSLDEVCIFKKSFLFPFQTL